MIFQFVLQMYYWHYWHATETHARRGGVVLDVCMKIHETKKDLVTKFLKLVLS